EAERSGEVDTEHMFGFTEGSDIGDKGEKELETDSTGRFGRLGGAYNNVATAFEAKYTLAESFRLSALATVAYYDISGVSELDDRRQGAVQSVSFEARYRVFDREHALRSGSRSASNRIGVLRTMLAARLPTSRRPRFACSPIAS